MDGRRRLWAMGLAIMLGSGWLMPAQAQAQVGYAPPPGTVIVTPRPGFDPYKDASGKLASKNAKTRRDAAVALGRLGDPRAVPDLVWLLQNDPDLDVRTGAAFALGAIGDGRAAQALKIAATRDRSAKVRQAAAHAHGKITFATAAPAMPAPRR